MLSRERKNLDNIKATKTNTKKKKTKKQKEGNAIKKQNKIPSNKKNFTQDSSN